jgi:hypothetical protein
MKELRLRGGSPRYFRATELQLRNVPHFHALMFGVNDAMRRVDVKDWLFERFGIARVFPYDATLGAAGYVSKYITKDARAGDWAIELDPILQTRLKWEGGDRDRNRARDGGSVVSARRGAEAYGKEGDARRRDTSGGGQGS